MPHQSAVWEPYAIRMANEGLPIGAMARALDVVGTEVRVVLTTALELGKILEMPPPDWPPTARRADRVPSIPPPSPQEWLKRLDDEKLSTYCVKVFSLTPLQGAVFALLLRQSEASKEMIHAVIEHRRQTKGMRRNNMDETDVKMVDVVVCHIRRKMKRFNNNKPPITTLWGSGYYIPATFKVKVVELINSFEG